MFLITLNVFNAKNLRKKSIFSGEGIYKMDKLNSKNCTKHGNFISNILAAKRDTKAFRHKKLLATRHYRGGNEDCGKKKGRWEMTSFFCSKRHLHKVAYAAFALG